MLVRDDSVDGSVVNSRCLGPTAAVRDGVESVFDWCSWLVELTGRNCIGDGEVVVACWRRVMRGKFSTNGQQVINRVYAVLVYAVLVYAVLNKLLKCSTAPLSWAS